MREQLQRPRKLRLTRPLHVLLHVGGHGLLKKDVPLGPIGHRRLRGVLRTRCLRQLVRRLRLLGGLHRIQLRPQQLPEAWAPEPPKLARRLETLRSKLRGVPVGSEEIAVAGAWNGPNLWA